MREAGIVAENPTPYAKRLARRLHHSKQDEPIEIAPLPKLKIDPVGPPLVEAQEAAIAAAKKFRDTS